MTANTKEEVIEEFKRNTREEYNRRSRIPRYCDFGPVEETDGNFIQIGFRPQIEKDIFDPKESIYRGVIGYGDIISSGEEKYFVDNIIKNVNSDKIGFEGIDRNFLTTKIRSMNSTDNLVLLVPISIKYKKLLEIADMIRYDTHGEAYMEVDNKRVMIYAIRDEIIDNNIILFNKENVKWKYKKFEDNQRLDIQINEPKNKKEKYDVIVRVVIKQEIMPDTIKVVKLIRN